MKTKLTVVVLLLTIVFSCKSTEEKNKERLTAEIKKHIENMAVKDNAKVPEVQINNVTYKMISENTIDTIKRIYYAKMINLYKKVFDASINLAKADKEMEKFTGNFDHTMRDEELDSYNKAKEYNETMQYYGRLDSIVRKQIAERKNVANDIYRVTCVCMIAGSGSNSDTLHYILDKDFNFVDLSDKALYQNANKN